MARPAGPVRTCVGCRAKAAQASLLRVVAVEGVLAPDPARRLPGRGASVHPDPVCVALAERRRAFGRALRLTGTPDVEPVREHVTARTAAGQMHAAPVRQERPVAPPPRGVPAQHRDHDHDPDESRDR